MKGRRVYALGDICRFHGTTVDQVLDGGKACSHRDLRGKTLRPSLQLLNVASATAPRPTPCLWEEPAGPGAILAVTTTKIACLPTQGSTSLHPPPDLVLAESKCKILQDSQHQPVSSALSAAATGWDLNLIGKDYKLWYPAVKICLPMQGKLDSSHPEPWDIYQGDSQPDIYQGNSVCTAIYVFQRSYSILFSIESFPIIT